jgi:hypothetical protein
MGVKLISRKQNPSLEVHSFLKKEISCQMVKCNTRQTNNLITIVLPQSFLLMEPMKEAHEAHQRNVKIDDLTQRVDM